MSERDARIAAAKERSRAARAADVASGKRQAPRTGGDAQRVHASRSAQQRWFRKVHTWTSMTSVLLMLFFGITGLLLNHPAWTFGQSPVTTTRTGSLPPGVVGQTSTIDFLAVSEYARSKEGVHGSVSGHGVTGTDGWITYAGPGLNASIHFDTQSGQYTVVSTQEGIAAIAGDIHRGVGTGTPWSLAIDISAVFLIVVSLTGAAIEIYNRSRHRRRDLILATAGLLVAIVLLWSTMQ